MKITFLRLSFSISSDLVMVKQRIFYMDNYIRRWEARISSGTHTDEEHGQPIRWTDSCCDVPLTFSKLRTSLDDLCPELEREPCLTIFFDCTLSNVNDAHCTGFTEEENPELCFIRASRYSLLLIVTDSYESINDILYCHIG